MQRNNIFADKKETEETSSPWTNAYNGITNFVSETFFNNTLQKDDSIVLLTNAYDDIEHFKNPNQQK